jgi:hypothetical protein
VPPLTLLGPGGALMGTPTSVSLLFLGVAFLSTFFMTIWWGFLKAPRFIDVVACYGGSSHFEIPPCGADVFFLGVVNDGMFVLLLLFVMFCAVLLLWLLLYSSLFPNAICLN